MKTGCEHHSNCLTCTRDLSDCPLEDGYSRKVKVLKQAEEIKKMKDESTVIAEKIGKSEKTVQRAVKSETCAFCGRTFKNVKAVMVHRYQCDKNPDCIKFNHGQRVEEYKKKLINDQLPPGHKIMTTELMADYLSPEVSEQKKREQLAHKPISKNITPEELSDAKQIILVIPDGWEAETVTISYRRSK